MVGDFRGPGLSAAASNFGESLLAWSLAELAVRYLDDDRQNELFVTIGVGDTFTAICLALDVISRAHCSVEGRTAAKLWAWLVAYQNHDEAPRLRRWVHRVTR